MLDLFEKIQRNLLKNITGVLWITEEALLKRPLGFEQLDYFFNSMLSKHLLHQNTNEKSYFSTTHFNQQLFLGHFEANSQNLQRNIVQILGLKSTAIEKHQIILISTKKLKSKFQTLIEKNPNIQFEFLLLD